MSVADAALSNRVSVVSSAISVLSLAVSVAEAHASAASAAATSVGNLLSAHNIQVAYVSVGASITQVALARISGLDASVAISGLYYWDAIVLYTVSAAQPVRFGISFPPMAVAAIRFQTQISVVATGGSVTQSTVNLGVGWGGADASGSILLSLVGQTSALPVYMDGMFLVSTVAGSVNIMAGASTTNGVMILRGSFLRLYRIG
jgi:hypothetical protein